ncbi:MAG: PilZ domain-containing protein [Candidatus Acidiferrales bacterium]
MSDPLSKRGGSSAGASTKNLERRSAQRFPFSAAGELLDLSSQARLNVRVADIGRNGCFVDVINIFPPGTPVNLSIWHAGQQFNSDGVVAYSLPGMGMGLRFADLSSEMQSIFIKWTVESGAEASLAPENRNREHSNGRDFPVARDTFIRLLEVLMRKDVLSQAEGSELLAELLRRV